MRVPLGTMVRQTRLLVSFLEGLACGPAATAAAVVTGSFAAAVAAHSAPRATAKAVDV